MVRTWKWALQPGKCVDGDLAEKFLFQMLNKLGKEDICSYFWNFEFTMAECVTAGMPAFSVLRGHGKDRCI